MGGGFSSKNQASGKTPESGGLNRVQYIEHRRRSSIIDMDVEKLMSQQAQTDAPGHISRTYRPTMMTGGLSKGASAAANSYGDTNGQAARPLQFSTGVEVFTRPMTLQRDKQTLHYTRQELFKMQQEAEEEDESFSIVGVKVQGDEVVYGIRWLDEDNSAVEWIKRQAVYEAGPTMLCEYESIHIDELMLMNKKLSEVLTTKSAEADRKKMEAENLRLKNEREKALAAAEAKAQAELRGLESSKDAANESESES